MLSDDDKEFEQLMEQHTKEFILNRRSENNFIFLFSSNEFSRNILTILQLTQFLRYKITTYDKITRDILDKYYPEVSIDDKLHYFNMVHGFTSNPNDTAPNQVDNN